MTEEVVQNLNAQAESFVIIEGCEWRDWKHL
jgi:hypothetical protein